MNWREQIIADWPDEPQKIARAKVALAELDHALGELAGLGHPLHVEQGYVAPPPPGWPKAVFHVLAGTRVVRSQRELDELGEDWFGTMEEARHAEGMRMQMKRGGIFNPRQMPTLLTQTPQQIMANQAAAIKMREDQRRMVNDARLQHRSGFAEQRILIDYSKDTVATDPGGAQEEGKYSDDPNINTIFERLRVRT